MTTSVSEECKKLSKEQWRAIKYICVKSAEIHEAASRLRFTRTWLSFNLSLVPCKELGEEFFEMTRENIEDMFASLDEVKEETNLLSSLLKEEYEKRFNTPSS